MVAKLLTRGEQFSRGEVCSACTRRNRHIHGKKSPARTANGDFPEKTAQSCVLRGFLNSGTTLAK
jgi:hypothetical protein